jgi:hypothetical protein
LEESPNCSTGQVQEFRRFKRFRGFWSSGFSDPFLNLLNPLNS